MTKKRTTVNPKTQEMVLTAILAALILLMTFCGIGYIPLNPVLKLTLHTLPVAVGSVLLGWKAGLILGGVFGLSSFITCFGMDALGSVLLGINPVFTFLFCVVPRLLCGVLPALIFKAISIKDKKGFVAIPVACTSTAIINTVLFLSMLWMFFSNEFMTNPTITEMVGVIDSLFALFVLFAGVNAILEAGVCLVAGTAIVKVLQTLSKRIS
ncbi:MAG: ECF transporter S component [Ruminococcus sp.]